MAQRDFHFVKVFEDGRVSSAYEIRCSKCPHKLQFIQHGATRRPPDAAKPWFAAKGWYVAARQSGDICPYCLKKPPKEVAVVPEVVQLKPPLALPTPVAPVKAMTREDRRIINDKLDEVYEKEGYVIPWTDAGVAKHLGVPKAWVAEVRDQFFGPEGSNAEIDDFLVQLGPLMKEAKGYVENAAVVLNKAETILKDAQTLARSVSDLTARIVALEASARKIERSIGR